MEVGWNGASLNSHEQSKLAASFWPVHKSSVGWSVRRTWALNRLPLSLNDNNLENKPPLNRAEAEEKHVT